MKVRWNAQYHHGEITGYTCYAWEVHPLLGEVHGTRQYAKTEAEVKQIARDMRKTTEEVKP